MSDLSNIILSTKRLILRTWKESDLASMFEINSDPQVMKYFPFIQNLDETQTLIKNCSSCYKKYGFSLFPVELKETSEFLGFVGLSIPEFNIPDFKTKSDIIVEIGWRLSSNYWNKGYATEAAIAVLDFAFIKLKLTEIISFTTVENKASRCVMEKIGLHYDKSCDFRHPKVDVMSSLSPHVLYRTTQFEYLNRI